MDLIFDINGTLTEHNSSIKQSTRLLIEDLCEKHRVILISGVSYESILEKIDTLYYKVNAVYAKSGNEKYMNDKVIYSKRVFFDAEEAKWIDDIIDGDVHIEQCRMVLTDVVNKEKTCDRIEERYPHLSCCINTNGDEIHILRRDSDKTQIIHEYHGALFFTDGPEKYQYDYTLAQRLVTRKVEGPSDLPQLCRDLIKM